MRFLKRLLCRMFGHPHIDMYMAKMHRSWMDKQVCSRCRLAHLKGAQGHWFYDDGYADSVPGRWSAEIVAAASAGEVEQTYPLQENMTRYTFRS